MSQCITKYKARSNGLALNILLLFLALRFVPVSEAVSFPAWLEPEKGTTPKEEVQCYSIPYGGIGFGSHVLTYYTLFCLCHGRRPMYPTKQLTHVWLDSLFAIVTFVLSVGVATFTILRCRNEWEYMLIAIWKIFMSTVVASTTVTAPFLLQRKGKKHVTKSTYCLVIYIPGFVVGFIGLGRLVKQSWHNPTVGILTYIYGGLVAIVAIVAIVVAIYSMSSSADDGVVVAWCWGLLACLAACGFLGVLYSDWILGSIAEDLVGRPSGDNAILYWTYFVAKKISLLSI